ncbi:MAG TPA: hypothetical protein VMV59_01900 [Candidatus Dormibacteraeota bacterium]|nr:hypothetical protein [Candidatus Dormibacteraeota bacterium]
MRKSTNTITTAQLLPPEPRTSESEASLLERLVHKKVAEIMGNREDLLLRPFFDTKRVSDEIRRIQTVPERLKWAVYFERWGCLACGAKNANARCGMCENCYQRTMARLRRIVAESMRSGMQERFTGDLEALAKKALRSVDSLPARPLPALKGKE